MTCDKTPQCPKPCGLCPERRPVPAGSESLADRLRDEADQARNDGADDIALLLDEAADALPNQPMVPLSAMRPVAVEAIRAITGCPDILGNGLSLVEELESVAKAAAALQSQPKPVPAGSEVDGERATPAATPPAGAGMVLVPVEDVAAASTALGNFVSDHGWGASDMQAMDNLDAHLAQHRARLQAAPSPAPAPSATTQQAEPQAAAMDPKLPACTEELVAALSKILDKGRPGYVVSKGYRSWIRDAFAMAAAINASVKSTVAALQPAPAPAQPAATAKPEHIPTPDDINAQDWEGMDGATAYQLIERHGEDWSHIGRLMGAWLAANTVRAAMQQKGGAV